ADGNAAPPGYYYLIVNQGSDRDPSVAVPSVARIVRVGAESDRSPALEPMGEDTVVLPDAPATPAADPAPPAGGPAGAPLPAAPVDPGAAPLPPVPADPGAAPLPPVPAGPGDLPVGALPAGSGSAGRRVRHRHRSRSGRSRGRSRERSWIVMGRRPRRAPGGGVAVPGRATVGRLPPDPISR
ncbi:MAG: hypothetical protein AB7V44_25905, partial [Pseudonocardia sp.]